jgi:hypothetical protein
MIEESLPRVVPARRAAARGGRRHKRWWLIAKNGNSRVELLTTCRDEDGGETLPVFGHEEEAEIFLHLGGYGDDGWSARESSIGEIVSVLCGPCSCVEGVALDPLPVMVDDRTLGLVWLGRERFLDQLLGHAE